MPNLSTYGKTESKSVHVDTSISYWSGGTNEVKLVAATAAAARTHTIPDLASGNVILSSGTGNVSNAMLAANAVDSSKIADGSIVNADVNASAAIAMSKTAFVAGSDLTLVGDTLNVDDSFVRNDGDDQTLGAITLDKTSSATNSATEILIVKSQSSGVPANGIGCAVAYHAETAAGNVEKLAVVEVTASDVTDLSEDGKYAIKLMAGGAAPAEVLNIDSVGKLSVQSDCHLENAKAFDLGSSGAGGTQKRWRMVAGGAGDGLRFQYTADGGSTWTTKQEFSNA